MSTYRLLTATPAGEVKAFLNREKSDTITDFEKECLYWLAMMPGETILETLRNMGTWLSTGNKYSNNLIQMLLATLPDNDLENIKNAIDGIILMRDREDACDNKSLLMTGETVSQANADEAEQIDQAFSYLSTRDNDRKHIRNMFDRMQESVNSMPFPVGADALSNMEKGETNKEEEDSEDEYSDDGEVFTYISDEDEAEALERRLEEKLYQDVKARLKKDHPEKFGSESDESLDLTEEVKDLAEEVKDLHLKPPYESEEEEEKPMATYHHGKPPVMLPLKSVKSMALTIENLAEGISNLKTTDRGKALKEAGTMRVLDKVKQFDGDKNNPFTAMKKMKMGNKSQET